MILKIENGLTVGYRKRAVATLTEELVFRAGEITLLLGLNGQGKTTLMKTMAGLLPPVAGQVTKTRVLYLSDDVDFPTNLTPLEIVKSLAPTTKIRTLGLEMLESLEVENKKYGLLSKGNRQKARIAFAEVVSRARNVNFLGRDEPFSGLDSLSRDSLLSSCMHSHVLTHPALVPI